MTSMPLSILESMLKQRRLESIDQFYRSLDDSEREDKTTSDKEMAGVEKEEKRRATRVRSNHSKTSKKRSKPTSPE